MLDKVWINFHLKRRGNIPPTHITTYPRDGVREDDEIRGKAISSHVLIYALFYGIARKRQIKRVK